MSAPAPRISLAPRPADADAAVSQALEWCRRGDRLEALRILEWAHGQWPEEARVTAHFAVLLCQQRGQARLALELGEEAARRAPSLPDVQLCLAEVLLAGGDKRACLATLREATARFPDHAELRELLAQVGLRRDPLVASLPRSHPFNKYVGLLTWRLGLR